MSEVAPNLRGRRGLYLTRAGAVAEKDPAPLAFQDLKNSDNSPQHYQLSCPTCGSSFADNGHALECIFCGGRSLLSVQYKAEKFEVSPEESGLFRYRSWLPVRRSLSEAGKTVTYRSEILCQLTGLRNLWIAFSGYWPERNIQLHSGTFKELEAYCVLGRLPVENDRVMIVASAGNSAAAFARICSANDVRCLIVVPESGLRYMRFEKPIQPCVKLVAISGNGDYTDAIRLANHTAKLPGFFSEGGAKNVARRDGLGTVLLNAYETMGQLPEYYFQAVGSGTGAMSVHENARRLTGGRGPYPKLWLSQNLPFAPIYRAWESGATEWPHLPELQAKQQIGEVSAQVLANRFPPYAIEGGLREALLESDGTVMGMTNAEAICAGELFKQHEGIDIEPAAAVAFASLLKAVEEKKIDQNAIVLLNITGGGQGRRFANCKPIHMQPDLTIDASQIDNIHSMSKTASLFADEDLPYIATA